MKFLETHITCKITRPIQFFKAALAENEETENFDGKIYYYRKTKEFEEKGKFIVRLTRERKEGRKKNCGI